MSENISFIKKNSIEKTSDKHNMESDLRGEYNNTQIRIGDRITRDITDKILDYVRIGRSRLDSLHLLDISMSDMSVRLRDQLSKIINVNTVNYNVQKLVEIVDKNCINIFDLMQNVYNDFIIKN